MHSTYFEQMHCSSSGVWVSLYMQLFVHISLYNTKLTLCIMTFVKQMLLLVLFYFPLYITVNTCLMMAVWLKHIAWLCAGEFLTVSIQLYWLFSTILHMPTLTHEAHWLAIPYSHDWESKKQRIRFCYWMKLLETYGNCH